MAEFEARPAQTMKEPSERIATLTGVWRSLDQVRWYLTGLGLKRRKTGHVPATASPS